MFKNTAAYRHNVLDDDYYSQLEDELRRHREGVQRHDFEKPIQVAEAKDQAQINQKWGEKLEQDSFLLEKHAR